MTQWLCLAVLAFALGGPDARAQLSPSAPRIAFLEAGAAAANQHFLDAFLGGLAELGYVQGKSIVVDIRWAEGQTEGFRRGLVDLVHLNPQVIVVSSTLGALEAKRATSSIPVVFIGVPEPVGNGLVSSLSRPGGNITGLARSAGDGLIGKTIQALKELAPGVTRMAILWNPNAGIKELLAQATTAAGSMGITTLAIEVRDRDGIEAAFAVMRRERVNGLFVLTDPLTLANRSEIVTLAAANRLPAVYEFGEFVRAGGLLAYAPSVVEQFRRAAIYVDKILRGMKPGDLPIEQPTKFEYVINLQAAKGLGISVSNEILLRADEVIR